MVRKSLLLASALILGPVAPLQAGGLPQIVKEPEGVEERGSSSSTGLIVPLLLLAVGIAAAVNGDDDPPPAVSDLRLKEDVRHVGMTPQGLPRHTWRHAGMPETCEGVLAQEVAMIRPDALADLPFGDKAVNDARLGLKMRRLN